MTPLRSFWRVWFNLALVVASLATIAKGQSISGTIEGLITDQQGAILPGVGVTATNVETGLSYQGVTDADRGRFVIPEVPPNIYRVRAQFSGFQTQLHEGVRVDVNRVTKEDFVLKVSTSTTIIVVSSDASMLETNTAALGSNFDQTEIRELPILTRDVNNLALLAPGVLSVRTFSFASTLVPFAVNGSGGRYNNFIIDSVSNNEPIFGGAATQFTNLDTFADYAITEGAAKAEFGRDSGSTVNVITKSGSSRFHTTAFWYRQDNQFDAMTRADTAALLTSTPPSNENKLGGTLGGPLGKKDTFFFLSYQFDRFQSDLSNVYPVIATVPTAAGLSALQNASSTPALESLLAYPSVSLSQLGGRCFAAAPAALAGYATPSTMNPCFTGTVDGYQFGSYDVPQANLFVLNDHQASARVDRRLNDSNDIYGRYLIDDLKSPQAVLNPAGDVAFSDLGTLPDSRSILRQRTQSALLDERFARASSLNEVRLSYSRIAEGVGPYNLPSNLFNSRPSATIADQFGGFGAYQSDFPSAGLQFTLGQDTSANSIHSNVLEAQDNYSLTSGRHFAKIGADFVRTETGILNVPSDLGHYFFGTPGFAGGFQSFLTEPAAGQTNAFAILQTFPDVVTSSTGMITGERQNELPLRETDLAVFIQDDFSLRPNLNISAGVRVEHFGQPMNGVMRLNPSAGSPIYPESSEFGPRLGVAWAPGASSKTVFRAGYALMYNQMPFNVPLSVWQSAPFSPTIATLTSAGAAAFTAAGASGFAGLDLPSANSYPNVPLSFQAVNSVQVAGCTGLSPTTGLPLIWTAGTIPLINCSTQNTVVSNLTPPYVQNWSAGVQRELSRNVVLEVDYIGTRGTNLYAIEDQNPNEGWNTACGVGANCLKPRLNPQRGEITTLSNGALSTYQALQARLNTRALRLKGNILTFTAAYTYSHLIDTASDIFGPSVRVLEESSILDSLVQNSGGLSSVQLLTPFPEIYNNLANERGLSSYNRRNRLVFSEMWGLPAPSNLGRMGRSVLGGWNVNGIGTWQSGQPFTPLNGVPTGPCADAAGDGQLSTDRPDIGDPHAPLDSVALLKDPTCRSTSLGYIGLNGQSILPSSAHFVQVPLGSIGDAGRNILTGPALVDFDFALYKQFHWGDNRVLEFRWEVYDVLNHPNAAYLMGNVFGANAQPTPGFAFSRHTSLAGVTGTYPENAIDATTATGAYDFLSTGNMNTGNRTMQLGIHLTF
jgi:hypothetical protein